VEQSLTLDVIAAPSHGTLLDFNAVTGQITYQPAADYHGTDSFSYRLIDDATAGGEALTGPVATVQLTVTAVNDPPVVSASGLVTPEDVPVAVAVTATDGDPADEQVLTYAVAVLPAHGTLSGFDAATGAATYTPDLGYAGSDQFTLTVTDDAAAGGSALTTATTVTVTVTPVNRQPVANDQDISVGQNAPRTIVLGHDADAEVTQQLTLTIVTSPSRGTLSGFDPATGQVTYTPETDYLGTDTFQFTLTDDAAAGESAALVSRQATVSITVVERDHRPTADGQSAATAEDTALPLTLTGDDGEPDAVQVLTFAIDTPPSHGLLIDFDPSTGTVIYYPDPDYNGADSFAFTVTDDASLGTDPRTSIPATVSLTLTPVNDPPAAGTQDAVALVNQPLCLVVGDDGDAEVVQTLTLTVVTPPSHGTLDNFDASTGQVTYTPETDYTGTDSWPR
jgi:hypothetical protein